MVQTATKYQIVCRANGSHCDLGSTLDLRAAPHLKTALLNATGKQLSLTLDAGRVDRLSTACIQLLIATGVTLKQAGLTLTVQNPSTTFTGCFDDLGLRPVLQQWIMET